MEAIRIARGDGTFITTEFHGNGSPVLGVVVSGMGYTYRNPLLYYAVNLLTEAGADCLLVDFRYYEDEGFRALDEAGKDARFEADAAAVADAVEREAYRRERIVLAGKSLGTSVIRRCLRRPAVAEKSSLILLTPGTEWPAFIPELVRSGRPTLVVGSLGDRYYPVPDLDGLRAAPRVRRLELESGDHSLETGDAEALYAYRSDPSVLRFQTFRPASPADAEAFIRANTRSRGEEGSWLQLGLFLEGRLAGDLGVHFLGPEDSQCEIGYTVAPRHRGKGIGKEAVAAVAAHLFGKLGKRRILASVDPDNAASIALLEGTGFRREARFRKNVRTPDGWADELVYALLAAEFEAGSRRPGERVSDA